MAKTKTFAAQVEDQVRLVERRVTAVFRNATKRVINEAQRPRAKGGRMPVQTGFLRNSGRAGTGNLPKGPIRGNKGRSYDWEKMSQAEVMALIDNTPVGEKIFFGWTAIYARRREYEDGFLRGAMEQWQRYATEEATRAKELIR